MQTPERDGIICDLCGTTLKDKFQYYSVNTTKVSVDRHKMQQSVVETDDPIDFEVCDKCYQEYFVQKLKETNKKLYE